MTDSEENYRSGSGVIVMCMHCRRTLRQIPPAQNSWELVERFVRKRPENVSDGLCADCLTRYYPNQ